MQRGSVDLEQTDFDAGTNDRFLSNLIVFGVGGDGRSGHEERFPSPRLSAGYGFRKETIAGMPCNGRDAP
jgi:hypothetical protein